MTVVRKPVLITDTAKVVPMLKSSSATALRRNRGDPIVTRMSSQRPGLLIANTTAKSSLGLDDTVHSHDMSQKALKAIFEASKAGKPDSDFLSICKAKPIQYLGASGGIVPTKHLTGIPKGNRPGITDQDVITKKYENFAVFSDFPKGYGGVVPNELWQDGTYEQMLGQVTKEHTVIPNEINFQPAINPRQQKFDLAGQVGSVMFGNKLHAEEIKHYFDLEKKEYDKTVFMNQGMTEEQAERAIKKLGKEKDAQALVKKLGISEEGAMRILNDADNLGLKGKALDTLNEQRGEHLERMRMDMNDVDAVSGRRGVRASGRSMPGESAGFLRNAPAEVRNPGVGITGSGAGDGMLIARFKTAGIPGYPVGYSPIGTLSMEELAKRKSTDKGKRYAFTPEQARVYQQEAIRRNRSRPIQPHKNETIPPAPIGRPRNV